MLERTDRSTTGPWSVPRKALAILMSLVLAFGLNPIANQNRAYALESGTTTLNEDAPQTDPNSNSGGEAAQPESPSPAAPTEGSVASATQSGTLAYFSSLQDAINAADAGTTVTLLNDVPLESYILVGQNQNIVLDLAGKAITRTDYVICNFGTLKVMDSSEEGKGAITATSNCAVYCYSSSTFTFERGTINAQESAIATGKNTGVTVNVTGGTLNAADNAVVMDNGSKNYGGNTFNISGGTFNGKIESSGYVACGIYAANDDTWNITGGTFNITGGAGIVQRGGTVNVSGDVEINTTGSVTGKVGDSRVVVPCSALVFDSEADYPGLTETSKMVVAGGKFKSEADVVSTVPANSDDKRVTISGGLFSSEPSVNCLAEGKGVYDNSDETTKAAYPKVVSDGAPVATAVHDGTLTYYSLLQGAVNAADAKSTVKLLANATENITVAEKADLTLDLNGKTLVNDASGTTADTIYVKLGATLIVKDSGTDGTVDNVSHAKAPLTNNGTVTIEGGKFLRSKENGQNSTTSGGNSYYSILNHGAMVINGGEVSQSGHFSSMIDNGYASYSSANERLGYKAGTNAEFPSLTITNGRFSGGLNTVKNDDGADLKISGGTFENFTQFVVMNNNVAEITGGTFMMSKDATTAVLGNLYYDTKLNKGNLAVSGGTFTAPSASGPILYTGGYSVPAQSDCGKIVVSGGSFNGAFPTALSSGQSLSVTGGKFADDSAKTYLPDNKGLAQISDDTYKYEVADAYEVKVSDSIEHGTVTVDPANAVAGATVTVTATPSSDDYALESISVTDADDKKVEIAEDNTFTMPASAITVSATFTQKPAEAVTTLFDDASKAADEYKTNHYNKETKQAAYNAGDDLYVKAVVGHGAFSANLSTVKIAGKEYGANQTFNLSVGNDAHAVCNYWKLKDGDLYVAFPVVLFEMSDAAKPQIEVGEQLKFEFNQPTGSTANVTAVRSHATSNQAISVTGSGENWTLTHDSTRAAKEWVEVAIDGLDANTLMITKKDVKDASGTETINYGFTPSDEGAENNRVLGFYAFGYNASNPPLAKDGTTIHYQAYLVGKGKTANLTLNLKIAYRVTATANSAEGGDVKVAVGDAEASATTTALANGTVQVTAEPKTGYYLDKVTCKAGETDVEVTKGDNGSYTFTMPKADVTVTATFARKAMPTIAGDEKFEKFIDDDDKTFELNQSAGEGVELKYASSDEDVATVDEGGKVTVKKAGEATITVTAPGTDQRDEVAKSITVTVSECVATATSGETTTKHVSLAAAVDAAKAGGTVTLQKDVELSQRVDVNLDNNASLVIDLGGKTITPTAACANGSAFDVKSGAVTIQKGKIDGTAVTSIECDPVTVRSGAKAILVDGLEIAINSKNGACAYAFDGGALEVTGGTYSNATSEAYQYKPEWTGMVLNQANVEKQLVSVTGGAFKGVNPALGDDSGKATTFMAEGYGTYADNEGAWIAGKEFGIAKSAVENGTLTVKAGDKEVEKAVAGQTVTVEATPADGYALAAISVTVDGQEVKLGEDNTFTMPAGAVMVAVKFNKTIELPKAIEGLKYTGKEQAGVAESTSYTLSGEKATNVGTYTATVTPAEGYAWDDGTAAAQPVEWSIAKAESTMTAQAKELTFTFSKEARTTDAGFDVQSANGAVTFAKSSGSADSAIAVAEDGTITIPASLAVGVHELKTDVIDAGDANHESKTVTVTHSIQIATATVTAPAGKQLAYNGAEQAGVEAGEGYKLSGEEATDAGSYTAKATLEPGYAWDDSADDGDNADATAERAIEWSISALDLSKATVELSATTFEAKDEAQAPTVESVKIGDFVVPAIDYKVAYENEESTEPDTYKVTVEPATGNLVGKAEATYEIVAAQPDPGTDPENPGTDPENPGGEEPGTNPENPGGEEPGTDPETPGDTGGQGGQSENGDNQTPGGQGGQNAGDNGSQSGDQPSQQPPAPAPTTGTTPAPATEATPTAGETVTDADAGAGTTADAIVNDDAASVTLTHATATGSSVTIDTVVVDGVALPVTKIAKKALKGLKAKTIKVADSIVEIGAQAFAGTKKLKTLTLGKGVTKVGKNVLKGSKVKKVTLKSSSLNKKNFKNLVKGSKVKTVKTQGVTKKVKAQYKKWAKSLKVKVK